MIESALGVLARQLSISDHATFQRSMRADLVAPSSRLTASSTANTCKVADLVAERTWPFVAKRPEQTRTECANVNGILRNVRLQSMSNWTSWVYTSCGNVVPITTATDTEPDLV